MVNLALHYKETLCGYLWLHVPSDSHIHKQGKKRSVSATKAPSSAGRRRDLSPRERGIAWLNLHQVTQQHLNLPGRERARGELKSLVRHRLTVPRPDGGRGPGAGGQGRGPACGATGSTQFRPVTFEYSKKNPTAREESERESERARERESGRARACAGSTGWN